MTKIESAVKQLEDFCQENKCSIFRLDENKFGAVLPWPEKTKEEIHKIATKIEKKAELIAKSLGLKSFGVGPVGCGAYVVYAGFTYFSRFNLSKEGL